MATQVAKMAAKIVTFILFLLDPGGLPEKLRISWDVCNTYYTPHRSSKLRLSEAKSLNFYSQQGISIAQCIQHFL